MAVRDGYRLEACDGDNRLLAINGHNRCAWHAGREGFTLLSVDKEEGRQMEELPSNGSFAFVLARPSSAHATSCFQVLMLRYLSRAACKGKPTRNNTRKIKQN